SQEPNPLSQSPARIVAGRFGFGFADSHGVCGPDKEQGDRSGRGRVEIPIGLLLNPRGPLRAVVSRTEISEIGSIGEGAEFGRNAKGRWSTRIRRRGILW